MHDPNKYLPIPEVDDWLNLKDWTFRCNYKQGQHGDFYWITPYYTWDFLDCIELPQTPFRILMTYFDWFGGAAACFGSKPGWQVVAEHCALSDVITEKPVINYGADIELMLIDEPLSKSEIAGRLSLAGVDADPDNSDFWKFIEEVEPYCFASYTHGMFFTAKKKELIESFYSEETLQNVERTEREKERAGRARMWEMLGPECGPETCVDFGCDRLRIQLAMRCFFHQRRR